LDMASSSPSSPEQSPGTVQRCQLGRGGAGSAQRQHDGGRALPPQPTLAQRPPARRAQTALLRLPARTGLMPGSARPPARPGLTTEATCSACLHVDIRRPPWRPAEIRRPPRSTRPPAKLRLPARNATPTHPTPAAAVRSPERCPPAARTPPTAVWNWGILGNDSQWPTSTSVRLIYSRFLFFEDNGSNNDAGDRHVIINKQ
jgi:hypothetical protein